MGVNLPSLLNEDGLTRVHVNEATFAKGRQHPDGGLRVSDIATSAYTIAAGFRGQNAPDGSMRVTVDDVGGSGYYGKDGSVRVTTTGVEDGALKVVVI